MSEFMPRDAAPPPLKAADGRTIVGWEAGAPVYSGDAPARAEATPARRGTAWLLKPGDIVCDWLKVEQADSRALLRLFVNLTLYAKIGAIAAFLAS